MKHMKLKIRNVGPNDFGTYRCVAKNSLGETDGNIKLDGKSHTHTHTQHLNQKNLQSRPKKKLNKPLQKKGHAIKSSINNLEKENEIPESFEQREIVY